MRTIEHRLHVLELEVRRSRRLNRMLIAAVAAIVCVAGALAAAPRAMQSKPLKGAWPSGDEQQNGLVPPQKVRLVTVEAERFVLLDSQGRSRARMGMTTDGPEISLFDEEGRERLELRQTAGGSGLCLLDVNESPIVSLQLPVNSDRARLEMKNRHGSSLTKAEGFSVHDAAGNGRLLLSLLNGNFPVLGVSQSGQNGPPSVEITASDNGARNLKLHSAKGEPLFSVSAVGRGSSYLYMRHPDHERSIQIATGSKDADGPVMSFLARRMDDEGGVLTAPVQFGLRRDGQPFFRIAERDGKTLFSAPSKAP